MRVRVSDSPPKNFNLSPTSTLAYGILALTSAWSLYGIKDREVRTFSIGMFSLMTCHALVGILRYGHPDSGKTIRNIFEKLSVLSQYATLPLINIDMYLSTQVPKKLAFIHAVTIALSTISHILNEKACALIVDLSTMGNVVSCLYIGYHEDNPWAIGLATVAAMNHFIYSRIANHVSAPKQDLLAIGLSFFNVFSVQALNWFTNQTTTMSF